MMKYDLKNMIFRITPMASPFFKVIRHNQRKLGRFGGSLRSIKRRIAKPIKFKQNHRGADFHAWRLDTLKPVEVYPDNPLYY